MRKFLLAMLIAIVGFSGMVKADEGMWLPLFVDRLNYEDMQKMGLRLTAEEIYSINHSSLKDAIIIFGGGCTGEIVSDQGLILTNHHCGYGQIQAHSTVEHDYLTDGFWAYNKEEELSNEGLTVQFLNRIEDVTAKVLDGLTDEMSEADRAKAIRKISGEIVENAEKDTHFNATVKGFFDGNEYYLFVYETYKDIRLVGAPPSSIGKFGADTDNWMWPRHTGDFSMFRIYTAPDGSPAEYSKDNVPMKPKHHLPVSLKGVEKDDYAMIMGYPGGTDRYLTSFGVQLAIDQSNMNVVKIREQKLALMREDMDADAAIRIKYASKYARTANYWKYFIGQTKGLKRLHVVEKKQALEKDFTAWVSSDEQRKAQYGSALSDIESAYEILRKYDAAGTYFNEAVFRGSEVLGYAWQYSRLSSLMAKKEKDQEKIDKYIARLREGVASYFKDYNFSTDQKLLGGMLAMYVKGVPAEQQPAILQKIAKKYKGDFDKYAADLFKKSNFVTPGKVNALLDAPKVKAIDKDPAVILINAFIDSYRQMREATAEADDMLSRGNRFFVDGLRKMMPQKKFYPNANFTMRLTYGQVLDYYPADAIHYNYFTTLQGVMEKDDPSSYEFAVPEKMKSLYAGKDYGRYAASDGTMHVGFLTNNDITGGNSGSPVINGDGELIGLAFDGNWEAMSGDIAFEPELQRTICVDIRYVLFVVDKFAGAKNIVDEMTLRMPVKKPVSLKDELKSEKEVMTDEVIH